MTGRIRHVSRETHHWFSRTATNQGSETDGSDRSGDTLKVMSDDGMARLRKQGERG